MFSAISFGVFCRSAPSTSAIMRSRNVCPGSEVIRTLIQSDSTRVPPVTADRSPPDSRMTGADSPVIADSSTEATPSMISPSPGMNSPACDHDEIVLAEAVRRHDLRAIARGDPVRHGFGAGLPQRVGLRLAAPFGHGFGEVGEQHREPQPERDLQLEAEAGPSGHRVERESHRRQHAADLDDEHDGILRHRSRVQLAQCVPRGRANDLRIPDGFRLCVACH